MHIGWQGVVVTQYIISKAQIPVLLNINMLMLMLQYGHVCIHSMECHF